LSDAILRCIKFSANLVKSAAEILVIIRQTFRGESVSHARMSEWKVYSLRVVVWMQFIVIKYRVFKREELYNGISNVAVWRVLQKRLHLKVLNALNDGLFVRLQV
jgi:hypothetical protein